MTVNFSRSVVFIWFCFSATIAQSPERADVRDRQVAQRTQAVLLLKENLSRANSISNIRQRADVVIEASAVLWDYDRPAAENGLSSFVSDMLSTFKGLSEKDKRTTEENLLMKDLNIVLESSISALMRRNPKIANSYRQSFFATRFEYLKTLSLGKELGLAADAFDIDENQSTELMLSVIRKGIPGEFPQVVQNIRDHKPAVAELLISQAIDQLITNPNYKPIDAIYLSAAVFNEPILLFPILPNGQPPTSFGMFTSQVTNITGRPSIGLVASYVTAAERFLSFRSVNQIGGATAPIQLVQTYFLLEKLRFYVSKYGLARASDLDGMLLPLQTSLQSVGFTADALSNLEAYARRLALSNNPLNLDDGTSSFEKAESARTADEKLAYVVDGIIEAIESKRFDVAEKKIFFGIKDREVEDALVLFLNARAAISAAGKQDWDDFEKRTERVADNRVRAFLYLKAITAFEGKKSQRSKLIEYVAQAEKSIERIPDKLAKASARVILASALLSIEKTEDLRDVPGAIGSINETPEYYANDLTVSISIPVKQARYVEGIGANSFRNLFEKLARENWLTAQVSCIQVKSPALSAIAQIAAAKSILSSIPKA